MSLVGNLEDLGLGDIFQIIFLSRRSGVLAIRGKVVEGKIYFKDGMVIAAHSTAIPPSNLELLVQKGLLTAEQSQIIYSEFQTGEDIYSVLNKRFQVPLDMAKKIVSDNVQDTVFGLFIEEGNFDFELKDINEEIKVKHLSMLITEPGLNPQFLAMEGSRLLDESRARAAVSSPPPPPQKIEPALPQVFQQVMETQVAVKPQQETEETPPKEAMEPKPADEGFIPHSIWTEAGITEESHVEPVISSPGLTLLKSMIFELQNPHSSSEITLLVLRFASELMNRAVLFIVKRDIVEGLGQFGVILKDGDPNRRIKGIKIQLKEQSVFKEIIEQRMSVKKVLESLPVHEYLIKELGGFKPSEVFLAPLVVSGRVAALLYGDNVPEEKPIGDTESLEIFLAQAGIAMERALLERKLSTMRKE